MHPSETGRQSARSVWARSSGKKKGTVKMTTNKQSSQEFGSYMASVLQDEAGLKQFVDSVTDPQSLRSFATAHGHEMSASEAEAIYVKARTLIDASSGGTQIGDELLESVNGGISMASIGAAIGGVGGALALTLAVGCVAAAPFTGGASLAGAVSALAGLSGAAAATVGAGALAAGAVGASIGAVGGHIVQNS
jgi:hypothetical protein